MMLSKTNIIVITGAAGFIGSRLALALNRLGFENLILVDEFIEKKAQNWVDIKYSKIVRRSSFFEWLKYCEDTPDFIIHLGARTNTLEFNFSILEKLNVQFSKDIWSYCSNKVIPLIYSSSAATYGNGQFGYEDNHQIVEKLVPLNPYGISKNDFDKWIFHQKTSPPFWAGLKFFNVYGAGEYHKGRMASVIFHAYHQINEKGHIELFRSYKAEYANGEQFRDFVYIQDVLNVIIWMMHNIPDSGLYNIGSGKATNFLNLAQFLFNSMGLKPKVVFIDMPDSLKNTYQYFTEANISKLKNAGYNAPFISLEEGIDDYIKWHLDVHYAEIGNANYK